MANIEPRTNKNGDIISYRIRVFRGNAPDGRRLAPYQTTFIPDPQKTERQNYKALNEKAVEFERLCRQGFQADCRYTFSEYAEYVISLKERNGIKRRTIESYRSLLPRIEKFIGNIKIKDIRPVHLNMLYEQLMKNGTREKTGKASAKGDLKKIINSKGFTFKSLADKCGVCVNTISSACHGNRINEDRAKLIADSLEIQFSRLFILTTDKSPLSSKTVLEYHRLINTILKQAEKEMLIPYNPASRASPPKRVTPQANYFEAEDIERILAHLEEEPLKWKVMIHLLAVSGIRRGELFGLKWNAVDWEHSRIHICINLLYSPSAGIYEDSTKTSGSDRYISLPAETMELLKKYLDWYNRQKEIYADRWHDTGFLFVQEKSGHEGKPMSPDSLNSYLNKFSQKYDLPHINPHAFRHTMASILFFNHIDSVSISKRLGHSKVSTTSDIYSHIMKKADCQSADCIADVILRNRQ